MPTLHDLRRRRGWTQLQLAALTGLDNTLLSRIETGRVNPTDEERVTIARAFAVDPGDLNYGPEPDSAA